MELTDGEDNIDSMSQAMLCLVVFTFFAESIRLYAARE